MPSHRIEARAPRGTPRAVARITDADRLRAVSEDAAHVRGEASALVVPASEAEIAEIVRTSAAVLPIGAQSSLTGGATPRGDVVVSTAAMRRIVAVAAGRATVQAGVTLAQLAGDLAARGLYYPPAPTFTGACIGGTVATNAAGAATFKYGSTREWVDAITVVLATGDVLDIERGRVRAHPDGYFEIGLGSRTVRIIVPRYRMPAGRKVSAGYFAAPGMDLIDLFIGAEGTLGIVTAATLRVIPARPRCLAFVTFARREAALAFVRRLRGEAQRVWRTRDPGGIDVSAIEHMDRHCLELARADDVDVRTAVTWPDDTVIALLVTLELSEEDSKADDARSGPSHPAAGPLERFARAVEESDATGDVLIALPSDHRRVEQLLALREEIPASVNRRIGQAKQADPRVEKTAGDVIVPFERLGELLDACDREFGGRHLAVATWGHISDGNLHPNVLPRSFAEVAAGREAIRCIAHEAIRLGGSPLAEHGVGRNRIKQALLEDLYGQSGLDDMRAVKGALDPEWKLARGVLFSRR